MRLLGGGGVETFDGGEVFEEFDRVQIGIDAEILREVAERRAQSIGIGGQVGAIPHHAAFGGARDGGQDAHQRGLACAVGAEQSEHARAELQGEVAQRPVSATVTLADILDRELQESSAGTA